jgi:hypothetical protein
MGFLPLLDMNPVYTRSESAVLPTCEIVSSMSDTIESLVRPLSSVGRDSAGSWSAAVLPLMVYANEKRARLRLSKRVMSATVLLCGFRTLNGFCMWS